jgi:hypothetical protein
MTMLQFFKQGKIQATTIEIEIEMAIMDNK